MIERLGNAIYWIGLVIGIPTTLIWIAGGLNDIHVIGLPFLVLGWLIRYILSGYSGIKLFSPSEQ